MYVYAMHWRVVPNMCALHGKASRTIVSGMAVSKGHDGECSGAGPRVISQREPAIEHIHPYQHRFEPTTVTMVP